MTNETLAIVGLAANFFLAYPVYRLLLALKSRQTIDPHAPEGHQVKQGTPTMGGLMILPGLFVALLSDSKFLGAALLLVGFGLIGFVDDYVVPKMLKGKRGLGWRQKLILQVLLSLGALWLMPTFRNDPVWLAFGAFLVLFFANAYNFADGLDGLAGGLVFVLGIGLAIIGLALGFDTEPIIGFALSISVIPFLFANAPPAKVFMGDVGSLPIGAIIGLLGAQYLQHAAQFPPRDNALVWLALIVISFILIVELVLVPIQVAYYKRTKRRIFPATPIHHAFEVKGVPETKIVSWFILAQIVLVMISLVCVAGVSPETNEKFSLEAQTKGES